MAIKLRVTDGNCIPIGDDIAGWTKVIATPTYVAAGFGSVTVPATRPVLEQVNADRARLVVIKDGKYFMGGPIEQPTFDWQQAIAGQSGGGDGEQSDPGQLTINFTDDFALIAEEVSYPDPAHDAEHQAATFYTAAAANAEVVMRTLVDLNIGAGAITSRKIPKLDLGTLSSVGTDVNLSTRFEYLGDVLRRVALAGGGLGFRTVQVGTSILFTVYEPTDLTRRIRFSRGLSNLREIHYSPQAPTCNVAIVCDPTGVSTVVRERVDAGSVARWGRIVQTVSMTDTSDTDAMDQAGDQALAQGAESAQVAFTALDTGDQRYGFDYALGDMVTVVVAPGIEPIKAIVRAVTLTADPNTGEVITPLIGSDAAITDQQTLNQLRLLEARLGANERGGA